MTENIGNSDYQTQAVKDLSRLIHDTESKPQTFLAKLRAYKRSGVDLKTLTTRDGLSLLHGCILNKRKDLMVHLVHVGIFQDLYVKPVGEAHPQWAGNSPTNLAQAVSAKAERAEIQRLLTISKEITEDQLRMECLAGNVGTVKVLVAATPGAIRRCAFWSTLYCAVVSANPEVVKVILEGEAKLSPLIDGDRYWQEALRFVVDHGLTDILSLLCTHKVIELDSITLNKRTVLDMAVVNGDKDMFLCLKQHGATTANTLLSLAVTTSYEFIKFFLETGEGDINELDLREKTPLHFAVEKGHMETVKLLLKKGASISILNKRHRSPLHAAADAGDDNILKLLIAHAQEKNVLEQLLKVKDNFLGSELCFLVRGRDHDRSAWHYVIADRGLLHEFREKMRGGAVDVAQHGRVIRSGWGQSPHEDVVEEVESRFDMANMSSSEVQPDMTALHLAILKNKTECALVLLDHVKDLDTKDHFGLTPVHLACVNGNARLINALRKKGAQITSIDHKGRLPSMLLKANGHPDILTDISQYEETIQKTAEFVHLHIRPLEESLSPDRLEQLDHAKMRGHICKMLHDHEGRVKEFLLYMQGVMPVETPSDS